MIRQTVTSAFFLLLSLSARANSAIGNGGDIITSYLERVRQTLVSAMDSIEKEGSQFTCSTERALTAEQRENCAVFIRETLSQYKQYNRGLTPIPFAVSAEPLLVVGPEGELREVDARTGHAVHEPIEFSFFRVHLYSPRQLLQLLAHEVGHKVLFRGAHITDLPEVLGFPTGRQLLDTVAQSIVDHAIKQGFLPEKLQLHDRFLCTIDLGQTTVEAVQILGHSPRHFTSASSLESFSTSIGLKPRDLDIRLIDRSGTKYTVLRMEIHEEAACRAEAPLEKRWTRIELVEMSADLRTGQAATVLAEDLLPGYNPICEREPKVIGIGYGERAFRCLYSGSFAESVIVDGGSENKVDRIDVGTQGSAKREIRRK